MSPSDIDELIVALHQGVFEEPYWATFLDKIRVAVGADYSSLVFRRADARFKDINIIKSGDGSIDLHSSRAGQVIGEMTRVYASVECNHAYRLEEIVETQGQHGIDYLDYLRSRNIQHVYGIRVTEPGGANAWLSLSRSQPKFPEKVGAMLERIAPHLSLAARTLATLEAEHVRSDIATDVVRRLNFGWITFDAEGRVIEIDPGAEHLFRHTPALGDCVPGQLFGRSRAHRHALAQMVADYSSHGSNNGSNNDSSNGNAHDALHSRAIHLLDDPWLDMLVVPILYRATVGGRTPIAVGYVHGVGASGDERVEQLQQLFKLTRSEAKLAIALSQGKTLAEGANELNLSLETARTYSKRIYAKTDTRGQADLVRIILASVIALS